MTSYRVIDLQQDPVSITSLHMQKRLIQGQTDILRGGDGRGTLSYVFVYRLIFHNWMQYFLYFIIFYTFTNCRQRQYFVFLICTQSDEHTYKQTCTANKICFFGVKIFFSAFCIKQFFVWHNVLSEYYLLHMSGTEFVSKKKHSPLKLNGNSLSVGYGT